MARPVPMQRHVRTRWKRKCEIKDGLRVANPARRVGPFTHPDQQGSWLDHANKQSHASHEATDAKLCGNSATTNENRDGAKTKPEIWFTGVIVWAW